MARCVKLEGSSVHTVLRCSVSSFATLENFARRAPMLLSFSIEDDDALLGAAESIKNSWYDRPLLAFSRRSVLATTPFITADCDACFTCTKKCSSGSWAQTCMSTAACMRLLSLSTSVHLFTDANTLKRQAAAPTHGTAMNSGCQWPWPSLG
jgi:hypothetical protein